VPLLKAHMHNRSRAVTSFQMASSDRGFGASATNCSTSSSSFSIASVWHSDMTSCNFSNLMQQLCRRVYLGLTSCNLFKVGQVGAQAPLCPLASLLARFPRAPSDMCSSCSIAHNRGDLAWSEHCGRRGRE
jgi:hypothetical protein